MRRKIDSFFPVSAALQNQRIQDAEVQQRELFHFAKIDLLEVWVYRSVKLLRRGYYNAYQTYLSLHSFVRDFVIGDGLGRLWA